jgi:hypothetical protein
VNGITDDPIHHFGLFFLSQLDATEPPADRDNKILKDLVIQIFTNKKSIVFITLHEDVFGFLGNDNGKGKTENDQDDKARVSKKFYKPKLFLFCLGALA